MWAGQIYQFRPYIKKSMTKATLIRQETKDLCFGKNARFYDRQEGCIETSMVVE